MGCCYSTSNSYEEREDEGTDAQAGEQRPPESPSLDPRLLSHSEILSDSQCPMKDSPYILIALTKGNGRFEPLPRRAWLSQALP
ncbi:hypothetical protein GOP47_0020945 [Adiantum capillus-veneris]|uniref:Uncharacterized protein n=1 Tax=Adiantum capillus-veneris TaxID=13818 RepID=A0A9D4UAM9_ADICA|nr:hypothetical protein GOP47_0020945 [Adiantum capillus-veneris]